MYIIEINHHTFSTPQRSSAISLVRNCMAIQVFAQSPESIQASTKYIGRMKQLMLRDAEDLVDGKIEKFDFFPFGFNIRVRVQKLENTSEFNNLTQF